MGLFLGPGCDCDSVLGQMLTTLTSIIIQYRVSLVAGLLYFFGYATLSYLLAGSSGNFHAPNDAFQYLDQSTPSADMDAWLQVTIAYSVCGAATAASLVQFIDSAHQSTPIELGLIS